MSELAVGLGRRLPCDEDAVLLMAVAVALCRRVAVDAHVERLRRLAVDGRAVDRVWIFGTARRVALTGPHLQRDRPVTWENLVEAISTRLMSTKKYYSVKLIQLWYEGLIWVPNLIGDGSRLLPQELNT